MRIGPAARTFGIALMLSLAACGLMEFFGVGKEARPFPHKVHVEEDLACEDCHGKVEDSAEAGMPGIKMCLKCHEGVDEDKAPEERVAAVFGENPEWSSFADVSDEVIFSHAKHGEKGVACSECHGEMAQNMSVTEEVAVRMDDCMSCHAEKGASTDCAYCHKVIRKDTPPPGHRRNWKRTHGGVVRAGLGATADRCELCHTESSCTSCHQDEAPRSHNNFWRYQGHAVAASVDRSGCQTCHRTDSCDRCHRETSPRNHVGSFGGTQNRHCLTCHFPFSAQKPCTTCHLSSGHRTAPPRPANAQHAAATEAQCLTCHTTIGLPHLDNGDSCTNCH